jgi:cytochrome c-type biogenesis protein CcmH
MTTFIIVAIALTLAVLALLIVPLILKQRKQRVGSASDLSVAVLRDQMSDLEAQREAGQVDPKLYGEEQKELERRAIEDGIVDPGAKKPMSSKRKLALAAALVVTVPALAVGLYLYLGSPDAMSPKQAQSPHGAGNHSITPEQIQAMTGRLAERLQANPDDGEGWLMLARSYTQLGRFPEAAAAFGRASALLPPNPNMLADYADVTAMAQGRRLAGEPEKIIDQALAMDPKHIKLLALSGSAAFERGDFGRAIKQWQTILSLVPPDSPAAQSIGNSIADAQRRMGVAPTAVAATGPASGASKAVAGGASVAGTVALAPELAGKLPPDATLYVFARPVDGSRIPLAMARVNAAKFPYSFKLDDSMAMTPSARLSAAKSVVIGARLSRSGEALAKPGDLEGLSPTVAVGAGDVKVTINSLVK